MSNRTATPISEQPGFNFDRVDVNRIKARLDPLGETLTYIERLKAIARAAHDYYWNMPVEEDEGDVKRGLALRAALEAVHWTEG